MGPRHDVVGDDVVLGGGKALDDMGLGDEVKGEVHDEGQGRGELGGRVRGMVRDDMVHDGHGIDELENVLLGEPRGHMAKA